jgi:chemotaxis protein methyltransferase CheR
MSPDDHDFIARVVRERSGLVLTRDKGYLIENRLQPLVRQNNLKTVDNLVRGLRAGDGALYNAVVDAMLAKDTAFFRDWKPFEHLMRTTLPHIATTRGAKRTFRILSAGASTGQEPYSVAMAIRDLAERFTGWRVEIVGIDISQSAIAAAQVGMYSQFDVQRGLPVRKLLQYFTKEEESWRLNSGITNMVKFQHWNLLDDLYPLGRFDIVLCRNVMVYFGQQTKFEVCQKLMRLLVEDGTLYLGLDETVTGVTGSFRPVDAHLGIYALAKK